MSLRTETRPAKRSPLLSFSSRLYHMDAMIWLLSIFLGTAVRYEFQPSQIHLGFCLALALLAILLQLLIGSSLQLYRRGLRSWTGTFEEAFTLGLVVTITGVPLLIFTLIFGTDWGVSRGKILIITPLALILMLVVRYIARTREERALRPRPGSTPVLILGGGYVGSNLIRWMMSDPNSEYRPVGVLDDDPELSKLRVLNVPVLGTMDDIQSAVEATWAKTLILAVNQAQPELLHRIQDQASQLGLSVKVMPDIGEVVNRGLRENDLRDLSIEDLLGRKPVQTNVSEIAEYLAGKRVLVTGAGGSIGAQLCVEINKYEPSELIMLDRDETGLQTALINVAGNGLLDTDAVVLADIRDGVELERIFRRRRPEVVFHAAALKHLPMLQQYPEEAWKTNVIGTHNVLMAAEAADVDTFINISTDKAANPTSALGHSKRLAEKLTAWFGASTGKTYLSVRFGNVIGSRGSMLPTFMRLIEEGRPLTVTHPKVTRYFMTIPEACQLVLQAGGIGGAGEVLILDMGEPVSILGIAERMIELSGKDVEIIYTGLREGEKLHEELVGEGETEDRPYHPKISHTSAEILSPMDLNESEFLDSLVQEPQIESRVTQ
ncbi:UDP-N-acetyl-alpha-D-glucosamine C6 dehydratase [Corynebacterium occultum]|uniref:UDP-N-acetyl-alpha-D-glucosamine C6 dehydratase n=1 Tax=Corynebacterium occultum TaxID=2675219 RepID=A0A6B8W8M9_9CORY|nr:nucleoside-diphosphate sugar epimerase/dehydratase [Corynebacterium occultum]QGU07266.1 UDP-N-acetyl-alpha-D-glucosamine C6 dehydratase [Corynebacterium occultum]